MSHAWKPCCDLELLRLRAKMLAVVRSFFAERDVLEVETPLLCQATGTDPQLDFFSSLYHSPPFDKTRYLQTSPEFAMKRLLAAGSGSIYQVCKAFRNGEAGRLHNPEFTILEWYRVGFDLQQLMDEVAVLIKKLCTGVLADEAVYCVEYAVVFKQITGLDALNFCFDAYSAYAQQQGIDDAITLCSDDHALWLDFIFSYRVQPALEQYSIALVYGFPAIQASLARINPVNPLVADRFEVFVQGIEIGNGFFELADAKEQSLRFDIENQKRRQKGLPQVAKDERFLAALQAGLPQCCGVAVGLDRLLMIMAGKDSLDQVLAFSFDKA